jgi:hypothetical protein
MWGDRPAVTMGTTITKVRTTISAKGVMNGVSDGGIDGVGMAVPGASRSRSIRRMAMMPSITARRWRRLERARALWAPTSVVDMVATPEAESAPRLSVSVAC